MKIRALALCLLGGAAPVLAQQSVVFKIESIAP